MKLAVSTLFCLHKPLEEAFTDIILSGSNLIELTDDGLHALDRPKVERLLELRSSYGLEYSLHAPFSSMNIAAPDEYLREAMLRRLEASIKWASALKVEALVFHPGAATAIEYFTPGVGWNLNIKSVKRIIKFAEEYGVQAMIENCPEPYPFLMKSVENFNRFYEESGLDLKMVLDIGHAHLRGEIDGFLKHLGGRVGHIHVSDNNGQMDEHLEIGRGTIGWERVFQKIRDAGFKGWVVIESFKGVKESIKRLEGLLKGSKGEARPPSGL